MNLLKSKRAEATSFGELVKVALYLIGLIIILPTLISAHIPTPLWIILIVIGLGWLMKR